MPGLGGRVVAGGGHQPQQQHPLPNRRAPARPQTVVQKTKLVKNACHLRKDSLRLTRTEPFGWVMGCPEESSFESPTKTNARASLFL